MKTIKFKKVRYQLYLKKFNLKPKKTKFCKYVGTKYDCCKKVCFENSPCKVRDYRNKYKL